MGAEAAVGAGDHGVGVAQLHGQRRDQGRAGAHQVARGGLGDAAPLHELMVGAPVAVVARVVRGIDQGDVDARPEAQPQALGAPPDDLGPADQDRLGDALVEDDLGRAQDAVVLAGAEDHPLGRAARLLEQRPHDQAGLEDELAELLAIGVEVGDRPRRHARVHGGLGDRGRQLDDQARIERLGDDLVRPEAAGLLAEGARHDLGRLLARQRRQRAHAGDLHLVVDGRGADIERAAEDVGEAQDVVDLVGIVAAAGRHDGVVAHRRDVFRRDLGIGIGQREDQRLGRHLGHHLALQHAGGRQAQEHVGAADHLGQRARLACRARSAPSTGPSARCGPSRPRPRCR